MVTFSWSDFAQAAFEPCLRCLHRPNTSQSDSDSIINPNDPTANRIRRARADELEGLLADVPPDTDTEAETHSLHSNPGDQHHHQHRRKKKHTSPKRITVFGFDLFGKPPPIQLPPDEDEDDDDDLLRARRSSRRRPREGRFGGGVSSTVSSLTFDSDAAPLDPAAIDGLTPAQLEQRTLEAVAEERRLKEERRLRRKERKELKRMARTFAVRGEDGIDGGGEEEEEDGFQGYPGSGRAYPHIPAVFGAGARLAVPEEHLPSRRGATEEEDDADADLDGALYARRSTSDSNSGGSASRSRTSASQSPSQTSDPARYEHSYNHHYISKAQAHSTTTQHHQAQVQPQLQGDGFPVPSKKKKSSSKKSHSSTTTSSSASLQSPVNTALGIMSPGVVSDEGGGGAHDGYGLPSLGLGSIREGLGTGPGNMPIAGFVGVRAKNRDVGAFLATRGDA